MKRYFSFAVASDTVDWKQLSKLISGCSGHKANHFFSRSMVITRRTFLMFIATPKYTLTITMRACSFVNVGPAAIAAKDTTKRTEKRKISGETQVPHLFCSVRATVNGTENRTKKLRKTACEWSLIKSPYKLLSGFFDI